MFINFIVNMRSILKIIFRISNCFFRNQKCTLIYEDHIRAFQKARNVGVPKAPSTPAEIRDQFNRPEVYNVYGKTDHEDTREIFFDYLYEGKDFSYCIFSSKKIIDMIRKIQIVDRHYLIDATFKVCFLFVYLFCSCHNFMVFLFCFHTHSFWLGGPFWLFHTTIDTSCCEI